MASLGAREPLRPGVATRPEVRGEQRGGGAGGSGLNPAVAARAQAFGGGGKRSRPPSPPSGALELYGRNALRKNKHRAGGTPPPPPQLPSTTTHGNAHPLHARTTFLPAHLAVIPEWLRIWSLKPMGLAAWAVAGSAGYFLYSEHAPASVPPPPLIICSSRSLEPFPLIVCSSRSVKPRWVPQIQYEQAREFTPKEVAQLLNRTPRPHTDSHAATARTGGGLESKDCQKNIWGSSTKVRLSGGERGRQPHASRDMPAH